MLDLLLKKLIFEEHKKNTLIQECSKIKYIGTLNKNSKIFYFFIDSNNKITAYCKNNMKIEFFNLNVLKAIDFVNNEGVANE